MVGKHYNWHKRWRLNVEAATASHESGFAVRYVRAVASVEIPEIGGKCRTADGQEWLVLYDGGEAELSSWLAAQAEVGLRDQHSISSRIRRLIREAGDLWIRHHS